MENNYRPSFHLTKNIYRDELEQSSNMILYLWLYIIHFVSKLYKVALQDHSASH